MTSLLLSLLLACGDDTTGSTSLDADLDGYTTAVDCDDHDSAIHPGGIESCNGHDDDCDGSVDNGSTMLYQDADQDGYGTSTAQKVADVCGEVLGYVADATDCDDTTATRSPSAPETCNGLDDNCNGVIDDSAGTGWHVDADQDGYGDPDVTATSCTNFPGYTADGTDCDDEDASINPGAAEHCDRADENCNGEIDEDVTEENGAWVWTPDADSDGASSSDLTQAITACLDAKPPGYNGGKDDCNDGDPAINPDAAEVCGDGIDQNCDGDVDEDSSAAPLWYPDYDLDGYGDMYGWYGMPINACSQPSGYVAEGTDCDDGWDQINPGMPEVCDWTDNDCDGYYDDEDPEGVTGTSDWYSDGDCDGYGDESSSIAFSGCEYGAYTATGGMICLANNATDCDDGDWDVNPSADTDRDGYSACEDCDDLDRHTYPGATEIANGYDDDCDSSIDE